MWKLALQPLQACLEEAWKPTRHANDNPKRHSLELAPRKLENPALLTRGWPTTRPAANHIATEAPYDKDPVCTKAIVTLDIAGVLASFFRRLEHLEDGHYHLYLAYVGRLRVSVVKRWGQQSTMLSSH